MAGNIKWFRPGLIAVAVVSVLWGAYGGIGYRCSNPSVRPPSALAEA
jgi:hypothetical protein